MDCGFAGKMIRRHLTVLFLAAGLHSASAFSLLGPFEPWMTTNLGFINNFDDGVDIGGPKNIGEGYRWNIPVITYGYDQSFFDYFGSNGVTAVESAWQRNPRRIWVHTCTYDHPRALGVYQRAGFVVYKRVPLTFPDPRLTGALPRDIQHPLLPPL